MTSQPGDYFEDETPELNITPLVDIMLVLLAILMVTAPSITYDESVHLPQGSQKSSSSPSAKSLIISINKKKEVLINSKKYSLLSFADALAARQNDLTQPVFIRADKDLKYDEVMSVLRAVKSLGFSRVALQTQ